MSLLILAAVAQVLTAAATPDGPRKLRRRQMLAAARAYFRAELRKPQPQLRDEWFAYVVAFGLGAVADRWFRRFGAQTATAGVVGSGSVSGGPRGSGAETSSPWTGGGGKFGGGGAGGSWVAAVGGVAAGFSAPSQSSGSSSSGGGGSSSSSGGGGGGGW